MPTSTRAQRANKQPNLEARAGSCETRDLSTLIVREEPDRLSRFEIKHLAKSIHEHGLLQPLVVDRNLRVIDGSLRLAAVKMLREEDPQRFDVWFPRGCIDVNKLAFDSVLDPARARAIECSANTVRHWFNEISVLSYVLELMEQGHLAADGAAVVPGGAGLEHFGLTESKRKNLLPDHYRAQAKLARQ